MNETLKKYVDALDPVVKQFISRDDWRKKIRKICNDYGVKGNEFVVGVENETLLIIIGAEYVGNLVENLQQLGISKIQAEPMADALARDILFDIAEYLSPKEVEQNLPDASKGLISDHEEILKNPIKVEPQQISTTNTPRPISTAPQPAPQIQTNPSTKMQAPAPTQTKTFPTVKPDMSWEERKRRAEEALKTAPLLNLKNILVAQIHIVR